MATNTEQNPNKTLDLSLPPAAKPDCDPSQEDATDASSTQPSSLQPPANDAISITNGAESKEIVANMGAVAINVAPLSDIQKKMRRAERFGISVQLSEQEKRNSRAERFGTRSTFQASAASKSEELKRNARAERFGITCPSTAADNEAKKKARLARFAPVSKPDPLEEEKRKARALRFSNPPSSSLSQANGKGNIAPAKLVVADGPEWQLASLIVGNFLLTSCRGVKKTWCYSAWLLVNECVQSCLKKIDVT